MNKFKNSMAILLIFAITSSQLVSCSKDSDLLSEYVTQDNIDISSLNILADDSFAVTFNSTHILDVLANDEINAENITISSVSDPRYGEIEIRENNTLQYIALNNDSDTAAEEVVTDTVIYTTETTDITSPTKTDSAAVVITISDEEPEYDLLSVDVLAAKADAEIYFRQPASELNWVMKLCEGGDQGDIYSLDVLQGMVALFEATGNKKYLNDVIRAYTILFKKAKPSKELPQEGSSHNDNYLSWHGNPKNNLSKGGILGQQQLSESRSFMHLSRLLWVLHHSPNLRTERNELSSNTYQEDFDYLLNFLEVNFWEKWFFRSPLVFQHSGMDSPSSWAYIGWNLWDITSKSKYHDIYLKFNLNIGIPGVTGGFRNHIDSNETDKNAYQWNTKFNDVPYQGRTITDHGHAARTVKYLVADFTYQEQIYNQNDMAKLINTIEVFWPKKFDGTKRIHYWLDGKDKEGDEYRNFMPEGWMCLGRFDKALQVRFQNMLTGYFRENSTQGVFWGELAYNKAYIDGTIKYPENYKEVYNR